MDRLSIELPSEEFAWAQSRVDAGEAESLDAYFRVLAARDRAETAEIEAVEALLEEGMKSGVDPRSLEQIFTELRAKYNLPG